MFKLVVTILAHCIYQSLRHPRTTITQMANPTPIQQSPIPWWGSVFVLTIGIITWCAGEYYNIDGLSEAARALVYMPLGNIFGMSIQLVHQVK